MHQIFKGEEGGKILKSHQFWLLCAAKCLLLTTLMVGLANCTEKLREEGKCSLCLPPGAATTKQMIIMWPSTTKWGTLRGISKFQIVIHCNKHYFYTFWWKIDHSLILLSKVMKYWTSPYMISFKTNLKRFGFSNMVIYVYFYGLLKITNIL